MVDKLIEKIIEMQNPTVVGLDPSLQYLPQETIESCKNFEDAGKAIYEYNKQIVDAVCDVVPAVKVQIAYYEMYGIPGLIAFRDTLQYASSKGLVVIADAKRNDIGSTAGCYSSAFLGETKLGDGADCAFASDYLTVNGYLGVDGIEPFLKNVRNGKGIFVLVKTSNPSSGQLQDLKLENGLTVYEYMGKLVEEWGADSVGKYGYSSVGAVVGATHKLQAQTLRGELPHTMFLVPGYGAQGGTADDLSVCFDKNGLGAIVNSSRGIICAYKQEKYKGLSIGDAARAAALDMKADILRALKENNGTQKIGE